MNNYYDKIIFKIKELIEDNNITQAKDLLDEELKMPYIPSLYEEELIRLNQTVNSLIKLDDDEKEISIIKIEEYLYGNDKQQLQAVSALFEKNLRNHIKLVQDYLDSKPNKEAASLLIDAMIEQELTNEFKYTKDNLEYTFIPAYLSKPYESEGFIQADKLLQKWISNDNPSMYEMCLQMLIHKIYLYLPLSYEEDEADILALSILKKISSLLGDDELYDEIVDKYGLKNIKIYEIES
ncbi:MAG: DUF3196 domain-containing protein [Erysipelotrichaceae bacterium]|jgi:hypothetical protein|nr:DUF3196 domain-containing protein [Bacillota bacterium]NLP22630.1 DUF3196 domain-containing protein [Erysipelotrichaceae bacterium]HCY06963.1 DUF3196 domain-containing protein [Erysipelotrichaceae bacterium]